MSAEQPAAGIDLEPGQLDAWLQEGRALELIDVREDYEREAGFIAGSRHVLLSAVSGEAETISREQPIVFYCRVGSRSQMAAQAFRAAGYEAYSMSGGLVRWAQEGRPLAPEGGRVADH
jgi:hydroxyacylglutathione hydrolase/adenylyltransferase/sulfurtransferase